MKDVQQDDQHIANLTVEETLRYAAWTKLPNIVEKSAKEILIKDMLNLLCLEDVKYSIVGDEMVKGISGRFYYIQAILRR